MDAATVVSIVPFKLIEQKPGVYPGYFTIEAATEKDPITCLPIIDGAFSLIPSDDFKKPPIKITIRSSELADAIVRDYVTSKIATGEDAVPGLFWVDGIATPETILTNHKEELEGARLRQKNWFVNLVKMADDDWARNRQHKAITDTQRFACDALRLNREWNFKIEDQQQVRCGACGNFNYEYVAICPNCRAILKPEIAKNFVFAGAPLSLPQQASK